MHPLHSDETATLAVLEPHARSIRTLPTHCINEAAELEGFSMGVDDRSPGAVLPVNRSMFFGHSLFECFPSPSLCMPLSRRPSFHQGLCSSASSCISSTSTTQRSGVAAAQTINRDVVRLMDASELANGACLTRVMRRIQERAQGHEASFECAPDNADAVVGMHGSRMSISRSIGKRAVDSARWFPEPPQLAGLYHAMVRGYQKDIRQHKLFIGVSGGCPKCCDSFYNLMLDVGSEWAAKDVVQSEEVWWLRKACQRARCMVAKEIADEFGLQIDTQRDVHGYDSMQIGVPTVDTVEFDLAQTDGDIVTLYNACCDTTTIRNGILCHMNPSEGYWLFKGTPRPSSRGTSFGSMFGSSSVCGVFPTRAPCYMPGFGSPTHVLGFDTPLVSRLASAPRARGSTPTVYQCFDEAFMRNLETMGWNRDHGVVELVPITVCAL